MSKRIIIDDDKLEHLLNCMAQLNFLPMTGLHADEPIIREAYREGREMLTKSPEYANASPPESPFSPLLHASAPAGMKCADCTMDNEPCPLCYEAAWKKRHPHTHQV